MLRDTGSLSPAGTRCWPLGTGCHPGGAAGQAGPASAEPPCFARPSNPGFVLRKPWCGPPAWAGPGDRCTALALTPSLLQLSCARQRSRCRRRRCHAARAPTAPARGRQPRWVLRGGGSAGQLLLWHLALIWGLRRGSGQLCLTRRSPHRRHGRSPRHGCSPRQPTLGARLLVLSRFCRRLMAHWWLARLPQLPSFGLIRSSPCAPAH